MRKEDILLAFDDIDECYIDQARPKERENKNMKKLALVASLILVVGVILTLSLLGILGGSNGGFVPPSGDSSTPGNPDEVVSAGFDDSEYQAGDNYERLVAIIGAYDKDGSITSREELLNSFWEDEILGGSSDVPSSGSNGNSITISQNQVENVEEPDIAKMTDKYIFRIGGVKSGGEMLRIYSVDGDNSKLISEYPIPYFDGSQYSVGAEMILSQDGNTVTIIKDYIMDEEGVFKTAVVTIDVSDVSAPVEKKHIVFNGGCSFARVYNGRLILGTSFLSVSSAFDWSDPEVYLPYYETEGEKNYFSPENIICPDEIYRPTCTSLVLFDENLNVMSLKAVFGLYGRAYVSEDKIVLSAGYGKRIEDSVDGEVDCKTNIAIFDYSSDEFITEGIVTVDGWVEDRFFVDAYEGHLRVVTNKYKYGSNMRSFVAVNSSLYVYELSTLSLKASVIDFAPEGELATAVRFDGDKLYVCTAEVLSYIDPIFLFDLSDYSNITEVNTGFIDGFSSTLISFGDGYLLGIGPKDSATNKVSIYQKQGEKVKTVAEYVFRGSYSTNQKAFLVNEELGLFGFAIHAHYDENGNEVDGEYVLLQFDGNSFRVVLRLDNDHNINSLRSVYYNGYLYILRNTTIRLEKAENLE